MMTSFALRCPGCSSAFEVRLGIQPTASTKFFVPCPDCSLPIRGQARGVELESYEVTFEADRVPHSEIPEQSKFVTVDPYVPSRYNAAERGQFGTFPTMTLLQLLGDDNFQLLETTLGQGKAAVDEYWPKARRLYEYYLAEDWGHFDVATRQLSSETPSVVTAHERATIAHQAMGVVCFAIRGDTGPAATKFLDRYMRKHTAALEKETYVTSARAERSSGLLAELQRGLFDTIEHYINTLESWQIGAIRRCVPDENLHLLDELTLFRDEFSILRDLYQQGFEVVCKSLRMAMAAQNAVKRGSPDLFATTIPAGIGLKTPPASMRAFDKISNAYKVAYVAEVPGWEGFAGLLKSRTRNTIGHATARHDLRTGLIKSDIEPAGVAYLDVAADVFGLFEARTLSLQVVRSHAVLSSPDFHSAR